MTFSADLAGDVMEEYKERNVILSDVVLPISDPPCRTIPATECPPAPLRDTADCSPADVAPVTYQDLADRSPANFAPTTLRNSADPSPARVSHGIHPSPIRFNCLGQIVINT